MDDRPQSSGTHAKGGKFFPALCNVLGTLILLSVIGFCLLMTGPRMMGYEVYNVVSGSMEPEIPVGSVIYVKPAAPELMMERDIIAFWSNDSVVCHRVLQNNVVEGTFTTKGDANAGEDMNEVPYDALIGQVTAHYPILGALMEIYTGTVGKVYVIVFAACGVMLNMLAGRLRKNRRRRQGRGN